MLVVFVSQCEKKALKRTREVLDAFANRIGDNTWQTAITEEGLKTVKSLLRKTATKSTAVSCHRVCTRKRTALMWIVGNKSKFNELGVVPVNWTERDLNKYKDNKEYSMTQINNIYANTKKQLLSQHLFAVGFLAAKLIEKLKIKKPKLQEAAFLAGILHDIGKLDPFYQDWLNKKLTSKKNVENITNDESNIITRGNFSFEKYPRHQEISWLFANSLLNTCNNLNPYQKDQILHSIYWHHNIPFRKEKINSEGYFKDSKGIKTLLDNKEHNFEKINSSLPNLLEDVTNINSNFNNHNKNQYDLLLNWNFSFSLSGHNEIVPQYKIYDQRISVTEDIQKQIPINSLNNIIRSVVISADRLVSSLSAEDLAEYIQDGTLEQALDNSLLDESNICDEIKNCLQNFENTYPNSERNKKQSETATKLAQLKEVAELNESHNIAVLQGPAGCGKTKIALEWALKTEAKKIIWVCPRVQVALGLLNDLTQDNYLPNSNIEIFTGEYKKIISNGKDFDDIEDTQEQDYFSGDIIITTIDQVINNIISHSKITSMITFMQSHVVFDEFHELIPMPAFNLLLAELIESKKYSQKSANTLLVSATPHNYFIHNVLNIDNEHIIKIKSFNNSKYQLDFITYKDEEENPLIKDPVKDNITTFIITNTAQDAQLGFLRHQKTENNILLHSKYTNEDKKYWFNKVFNSFKEKGNKEYQILRSGPIVQASLNITCDRMYTDLTNAENYLQRLGRLDRFGKNDFINIYSTVIPNSIINKNRTHPIARFLNRQFIWQSSLAWMLFLQDKLTNKKQFTLNEIYKIYEDFYNDETCQNKISEDIIEALKNSITLINKKITDPLVFPPKSKKKDNIKKISNNSLRGDNRFVQMALCIIDENLKPTFINEYAYDENTDHNIIDIGLTESFNKITGYNNKTKNKDSEKDLVAFMKAKHHNIKEGEKPYNDIILLNDARSPEHPIYVSYTPKDLEPIGGEKERHKYAIYYVTTDKQPVGSMSIDKLV